MRASGSWHGRNVPTKGHQEWLANTATKSRHRQGFFLSVSFLRGDVGPGVLCMNVGLLTGGGDCPGLNAVIRAVVRKIHNASGNCIGFLEGWRGLIEDLH